MICFIYIHMVPGYSMDILTPLNICIVWWWLVTWLYLFIAQKFRVKYRTMTTDWAL